MYWDWMEKTVIPFSYNDHDYNYNPTTRRARMFLSDQVFFRLSNMRFRQLRILKGLWIV